MTFDNTERNEIYDEIMNKFTTGKIKESTMKRRLRELNHTFNKANGGQEGPGITMAPKKRVICNYFEACAHYPDKCDASVKSRNKCGIECGGTKNTVNGPIVRLGMKSASKYVLKMLKEDIEANYDLLNEKMDQIEALQAEIKVLQEKERTIAITFGTIQDYIPEQERFN